MTNDKFHFEWVPILRTAAFLEKVLSRFCLMRNKCCRLKSCIVTLLTMFSALTICLGFGNSNFTWHTVGGVVLLINEAVTVTGINHSSPCQCHV